MIDRPLVEMAAASGGSKLTLLHQDPRRYLLRSVLAGMYLSIVLFVFWALVYNLHASPFGKVLCTSVNDAALHGLPHDYALKDGDLVSLDFAASVDGWVADSAVSVVVGTPAFLHNAAKRGSSR